MSRRLFDRSADLRRLVEDGYSVVVEGGELLVLLVPYVDEGGRVALGTTRIPLVLAGERTVAPVAHQSWFDGGRPCDARGRPLEGFRSGGGRRMLCLRPGDREFLNFHEFAVAHVEYVARHARAVDPTASARRGAGAAVPATASDGPFVYSDVASARYRIVGWSDRLAGLSIGIVGLGGTGGYVLDLVAKTPVAAIHLFDDDVFLQHNAFRAPGAASIEDVAAGMSKVHYFATVYGRMHAGIVPHRVRFGPVMARPLQELDFVFLCIDDAGAKPSIVRALESVGVPFVDSGIGLFETERGLGGIVRTAASRGCPPEAAPASGAVPGGPGSVEDPYAFHAQVADLNALAASLSVLRWKRRFGFYADEGVAGVSAFAIASERLIR
jgi:hypothetical protein